MKHLNVIVPNLKLKRIEDIKEEGKIDENLIKKINSCKLMKKLKDFSQLNLIESEPYIVKSESQEENYEVNLKCYVGQDIFKSPLEYLIDKKILKERNKPYRFRNVLKPTKTEGLKTIRIDLRENNAIAYIDFYLKE